MNGRILGARMAIVALALLGVFDSAILLRERAAQLASEVCVFETACEQLRMGEWSTIPAGTGVPVPALGLAGFGALLALAAVALLRDRLGPLALAPALLVATGLGLAFAAYLLLRQYGAVGALCARCLPSAALALGSWLAALAGFPRRAPRSSGVMPTGSPADAAGEPG